MPLRLGTVTPGPQQRTLAVCDCCVPSVGLADRGSVRIPASS